MGMSYQRADATLTAALKGIATPFVWLHTGSPGEDGTDNVAQLGAGDIVRKAIAFGAIGNHATFEERRVLSDGIVEWSGAEIDVGQEITHFSIWSADEDGSPEFIEEFLVPKTVGSDGASIGSGDLEVAISVFVKPV